MECAAGNELEIKLEMYDLESIMWLNTSFYIMNIIIVLINWLSKISYGPGDQKLMINLEWPKNYDWSLRQWNFMDSGIFMC